MDIRKIRKLIELIQETGVGEIEVKTGDDSVRISRTAPAQWPPAAPPAQPPPAVSNDAYPNQVSAATAEAKESKPEDRASQINDDNQQAIKSPMVGTVYLSSQPGEPPFVKVGDKIKKGQTICLIEAMKMFNKIEAEKSGTITARLVDNEQPVEFDQPLFLIEPNE